MENVEKLKKVRYLKPLKHHQPVENLWKKLGSFPQAVEKNFFLHRSSKFSTSFYQGFPQKKPSFPQAIF